MQTASRFDIQAAQWDNNPTRVELARAVGLKIRAAVPIQPHWRALDYGAGTGLVTLHLQPHLKSITAVDVSSGMLETLGKKLAVAEIRNVQTRFWNLENEAFPETGFDLVVSSMTLHHIKDVPKVFKNFAALLKPGGWLAVADLDSEDGSFHGQVPDVFHQGFNRQQIVDWLQVTGFKAVSLSDAHRIEKTDSTGVIRSYGVFLAVGMKG